MQQAGCCWEGVSIAVAPDSMQRLQSKSHGEVVCRFSNSEALLLGDRLVVTAPRSINFAKMSVSAAGSKSGWNPCLGCMLDYTRRRSA